MMQVILLLVILNWPWRAAWLPEVLSMGIALHIPGESPCRPRAIACYAYWEETMYVSPHPADWQKVGGLERIILHELQHHLQYKSGMWEAREWDTFGDEVVDFYLQKHYSDHERGTNSAAIAEDLRELHANIPALFQGEIPCELEEWYPWFDLRECCELEIENAHSRCPTRSLGRHH